MRALTDTTLRILYRGRLSSCNYDCSYCPFAKRRDTRATLQRDAAELRRFVRWVADHAEPVAILFTPWGEGLVRKHYPEALIELSHAPNVQRVAIQTNLSSNLCWVRHANAQSLALWCTFHPSQVTRQVFLERLAVLRSAGIRFSVGIVGAHQHFAEIKALRGQLRAHEYLWINALSPRPANYYSPEQLTYLTSVDPHFAFNAAPPPSLGAACRAGNTSISVDGDGNVRPCHFLYEPLGNLYDDSFLQLRRTARCSNTRCNCFIGYIQRTDLPQLRPLEQGALERMWDWNQVIA